MELPVEFMNDLDLTPYGYQIESMLDEYNLSNFHSLYYVTNTNSGSLLVAKVTDIYGVPKHIVNFIYNESNILEYLHNCWEYQHFQHSERFDHSVVSKSRNKWDSKIAFQVSNASTCTTPSNDQDFLEADIINFDSNLTSTMQYDSENDIGLNTLTCQEIQESYNYPIVKLESVITCNSHIVMILENCEGGNLYSLITEHIDNNTHLPVHYIKSIISQLLRGLQFIHSMNIFHGDINPSNILFLDKQRMILKISDFETSQKLDSDDEIASSILVNTSANMYSSPEQIIGTDKPTASCDLWSAGCILYELLTFSHAFPDNIFSNTSNALDNVGVTDVYYEYKSQLFKNILQQYTCFVPLLDILLDFDPVKRLDAYSFF